MGRLVMGLNQISGRIIPHKLKHFRGGVTGTLDQDIKGTGFQDKAGYIRAGTIPDLGFVIPG
jgi:hypothetical protein